MCYNPSDLSMGSLQKYQNIYISTLLILLPFLPTCIPTYMYTYMYRVIQHLQDLGPVQQFTELSFLEGRLHVKH